MSRLPEKVFKKKILVLGISLTLSFFNFNAVASADTSTISNNDFEIGVAGDTDITGWTPVNERIDLGVDSIAGCLTVDTSDYSSLRDYSTGYLEYLDEYEIDPGMSPISSDPAVNNDSAISDTLLYNFDGSDYFFEVEIADGSALPLRDGREDDDGNPLPDINFQVDGQVLQLASDMYSDEFGDPLVDPIYGYVAHGPAVYSDTFTARTIDDLFIDWAAVDEADDYHVFGYLLNVDTCEQTEVIDSTGELSEGWITEQVAIPTNGNYRFVFISGTFDKTFGGAAGAFLYIDNVNLTVNEERQQEELLAQSGAPTIANGYRADALGSVYFAPGSSKLSNVAKAQIKAIVDNNSSAIYKVTGYVQKSGSSRNDQALSVARARAVESYLNELGANVTFTVVVESGLVPSQDGTTSKARKATLFAMVPVVL